MNLYFVSYGNIEDGNYEYEFIVANSETEAEDNFLNKYRGNGLNKNSVTAYQIEVDGYTINVTPTAKNESRP